MRFREQYAFLSNFYPARVICSMGIAYSTVEHAYQASKVVDIATRQHFAKLKTPVQAKQEGKRLIVRPDFMDNRIQIMEQLLRQKFYAGSKLAISLQRIEENIVEENYWGDTFWGTFNNKGANNLGKILMKIRDELNMDHCLNSDICS